MTTVSYKTHTTSAFSYDSTSCPQNAITFNQANPTVKIFQTWDGTLTSNLSIAVKLAYPYCIQLCGGGHGKFDLALFITAVSAWLFPWLALIGQLPYETINAWENILSFFLCVGSPQLIAYSLAIRVLVGWWIHARMRELVNANNDIEDHPDRDGTITRLQNVCNFLVRSMSSPIERGRTDEFRQLIRNPGKFWEVLSLELVKAEREW